MSRFYCLPQEVKNNQIVIERESEVRHITTVLRHKKGDKVVVFDGSGQEYHGFILSLSKQKLVIQIESTIKPQEVKAHITLACALPKKSKFDFIIQKATELGVDEVIPIITERTIVKKKNQANKLNRWQKIVNEAAKQCGRVKLPKVNEICDFEQVLGRIKEFDLALIPHLAHERRNLQDLDFSNAKSAIVFIGPEGDFSDKEIEMALNKGCIAVTLGPNVLKVDTAAIFSVGILSYLL